MYIINHIHKVTQTSYTVNVETCTRRVHGKIRGFVKSCQAMTILSEYRVAKLLPSCYVETVSVPPKEFLPTNIRTRTTFGGKLISMIEPAAS
ncbi:hypothetical protein K0M31_009249 [Melipona bicolor]|uniref:Uncharacterized protein n=1 Tax=Melipona bicolor TaxID=60889 RepID=A0AA40FPA6_9HYME|nr:hypothetical protein K0M31_009249 [Melipona bicolor]